MEESRAKREGEKEPWADITPKVCGGWRIMVMVSCGSSIKQQGHWDYITKLFSK